MSALRPLRFAAIAMLLALAFPSTSPADEPEGAEQAKKGIDAPAAFDLLKSLVGTWEQRDGENSFVITYRLTANDSAVVETYGPGTEYEMLSVYHLDGDQLRMTHYCAAGNQPRVILDQDASSPEALVFAFDGGSNLDPAKDMHMHEGRLLLHDADHYTGEWTGYLDGKPSGTHAFEMTRVED
ncbi:hypothetical protein [Tautonia plasticadhaerens]|uniref:Uncharacterized protein n=1 Tax=Tautonia plasticadhaerens TaxID=2527974 RepID=A0A518HD81_9BACT|nr:hypothetical protein [Tautonia plasticadhaerens]QDV38783.1 hypothetical protein ElP_67400 [Tautonia plasticadhaerens]